MSIYCGNNFLDQELRSGRSKLGTPYLCLRKGIGTGINLPIDPKQTCEYIPIDKRKIYCGNSKTLPKGYYSTGNLPQCLQKGIGIGRCINREKSSKKKPLKKSIKKKSTKKKPLKKSRTKKKSIKKKSTKRKPA
jgi:hypothetical protein